MDAQQIGKLQESCREYTLLYVEDNEIAREATLDVLQTFFFYIDTAHDGEEGLQKFQTRPYDLVITDINMPKMNGIEMIEQIKQIDQNVPILITSAYNEPDFFLQTIKLGVEGYLLKPLDMQQFLTSLNKAVEKLRLRRENEQYRLHLEQKVQQQVDQLRQKDEIIAERSKFAVMGEMIDAIAHQYKQPLSIIQLQAQQLEYTYNEFGTVDKDVIEDSTRGTMRQVDHLIETIDHFRSFFRPDYTIERVSLDVLLGSVSTLLQDELRKHRVKLSVVGDSDTHVYVIATDLKHLLINLINNAKDAFEARGIDRDREVEVLVQKDEENTYLKICDNAGGIDAKVLPNIFKPNVSTKKFDKGTGIGLYICTLIVKKIGASLEADNWSKGAVFTVKLPHKRADA
ncbi:MAG: response regulator [Campylobacterota bacterium]